jgi:TolB protein
MTSRKNLSRATCVPARWLIRFALFLACGTMAAAATTTAAPPTSSTGSTDVMYQGVKRSLVSVTSSTPELAQLMQHAFSIHGAFDLAAPSHAEYTLHFESAGANGANRVTVSVTGKMTFTAEGAGTSWREAAYRAADTAVQKITNLPGIFAGKLAFVSERMGGREIFSSDLFGQPPVLQFTNYKRNSYDPHWSPDGAKLLYTSDFSSGFPDIILLNTVTHQQKVFMSKQGTNTGAVFSPDGAHVAMILSATGNSELYVCDADGSNLHHLTQTAAGARDAGQIKSSPCWSPDGKQIMLDSDPGPLLHEVAAAGGAMVMVTPNYSHESFDPAWNPRDPDIVAFMTQTGGSQIATFNFKTGKVTVLTEGSEPCWANDGRHLIITRRDHGKDQLYLFDTVTSKTSALTTLGASQASYVYQK